MRDLRQLGSGIIFAALSLFLIVGGLSAALAEMRLAAPPLSITETSLPAFVTGTSAVPSLQPLVTIPVSPSLTATIPAPPTSCPPPSGWVAYIVQPGDNLVVVAAEHGITPTQLKNANCLIGDALMPNTRIYLPLLQTATATLCQKPYGWISYTVQAGDNLYRLSLAYRVSVRELQNANCLGNSTKIKVGQKLYVPNVATSTPEFTLTPTATLTPLYTATETQPVPTSTATETGLPTATSTPEATATDTPSPTATFTLTATATATPTPSATDTPTP